MSRGSRPARVYARNTSSRTPSTVHIPLEPLRFIVTSDGRLVNLAAAGGPCLPWTTSADHAPRERPEERFLADLRKPPALAQPAMDTPCRGSRESLPHRFSFPRRQKGRWLFSWQPASRSSGGDQKDDPGCKQTDARQLWFEVKDTTAPLRLQSGIWNGTSGASGLAQRPGPDQPSCDEYNSAKDKQRT
jgi:hypothetical protein